MPGWVHVRQARVRVGVSGLGWDFRLVLVRVVAGRFCS